MNFIFERAIRPRQSTHLLFQERKFSDIHGLFLTFLGLSTFAILPRLMDPGNPRSLEDGTEILTTILFPAVIFSIFSYSVYGGLLFLGSKIASAKLTFRQARLIAGGSFWIPMIPLAPLAFVGVLLTGGDPLRNEITSVLGLPVSLILFGLMIWGLIIQILTFSESTGKSLLRSSLIVVLSSAALLLVTIGPVILAFTIFG